MEDNCRGVRMKRPYSYHERDLSLESNGGWHRRMMSGCSPRSNEAPLSPTSSLHRTPSPNDDKTSPNDAVFRLLCPEAKAGSVIGKGGTIIKTLRQETGARITIADLVPGADDRVVLISAPDRERDGDRGGREGRDRDKDWRDGNWPEEGREECNGSSFDIVSPAQVALLRIHSRIVEGLNGVEEDPYRSIATRLLVPNSQVGCLLGKRGKIVQQMREETNTQIRILSRDQFPLCTLPSDEIVQIVGEVDAVKKALEIVSTRLWENPPRDPTHNIYTHGPIGRNEYCSEDLPNNRGGFRSARSFDVEPLYSFNPDMGISHRVPRSYGASLTDYTRKALRANEEIPFCMLCPDEKVERLIGNDGEQIRSLEDDTGATIRISDALSGSDERVVFVTAPENLEEDISPAQEALLHIQSRIADLGLDEDAVITTRLLVPSNEVGCILGRGGSIISELRRETHANIRILEREDVPKCALPGDEVVQIVGDIQVSRDALIQVTGRLRMNFHNETMLSIPQSPPRASQPLTVSGMSSTGYPSSSYQGSSSPYCRWSSQDGGGGRILLEADDSFHQLGGSSRVYNRPTLGGALVTKTTVEVAIPEDVANAFLNHTLKNNISQIRQLTQAKVNVIDPTPGVLERIVEISGMPEQTEAAQSLLHTFVLNAQQNPSFVNESNINL